MTKKKGNQPSSSFNFKIKITRIAEPESLVDKMKPLQQEFNRGLYNQMKTGGTTVPYNKGEFSIDNLKEVFGDLFNKTTKGNNRQVKIITNQEGCNEFEKALKEQVAKTIKKDEYRKKLDFRSKILKQTYKFR